MKTQISRFERTRERQFSGVYQQQGRMLTDADWNAMSDILKSRLDAALADIVGSGTPDRDGLIVPQGGTWEMRWGTSYANGHRAVVQPADPTAPTAFDYTGQRDFPAPPDLPAAPESYQYYLDVWERSINALEDPLLADPGLHGADTTTRTATMAQVKWAPLIFDPEDPAANPPIGTLPVTVRLRSQISGSDPCEPCEDEVTLDTPVGNYLFRVEVHHVDYLNGEPQAITFKWSSENGAEGATVDPQDHPPGFAGTDWVYEFYHGADAGSASDKHLGYFAPDTLAAWQPERGEFTHGYPEVPPAAMSLVRRWDGYCQLVKNGTDWHLDLNTDGNAEGFDRAQRLSTSSDAADHGHVSEGAVVTLNLNAITLEIDMTGTALAGDFWTAGVRDAIHRQDDLILENGLPQGIHHHYACIARVEGGVVTPLQHDDCQRHTFPRLTNLHADDVCFDDTGCDDLTAATVQDALLELCRERDLRHHNRHLHGWGIVCGLIVECDHSLPDSPPPDDDNPFPDPDSRCCVTLSPGYALARTGEDIVLDNAQTHDVKALVDAHDGQAPPAPILDDQGNGSACLLLVKDEQGDPSVGVEPYGNSSSFSSILDGTVWKHFWDECVLGLVNDLRDAFDFLDQGDVDSSEGGTTSSTISPQRQQFVTLINLLVQLVYPTHGQYVYLSRQEHTILEVLFNTLKERLSSKTFCAMFSDIDFPDYPFANRQTDTVFSKNLHTRLRVHPDGSRVYSYNGADNTINVFATGSDATGGKLVEVIAVPSATGGVSALEVSEDGRLLYVVAALGAQDSVLSEFVVGEKHEPRRSAVLCDVRFNELQLGLDTKSLLAIDPGRGLFVLRPELLFGEDKLTPQPTYAFNASGHLVVRRKQGIALATSRDDSGDPATYNSIAFLDLSQVEGDNLTPPLLALMDLQGNRTTGSDGMALREADQNPALLYVVANTAGSTASKLLLTFELDEGQPDALKANAALNISNTNVAITFDAPADRVLLAFEGEFRLQTVSADGSKPQTERVPVQINPTDVQVSNKTGTVYALNYASNTLTVIPSSEVEVSDTYVEELRTYRQALLDAFFSLFGGLLQYFKDCFCHELLIKCPDEDGDGRIYLACVEFRGGEIYNICNFSKRKYVKSFPTVEYWLSVVPILPLVSKLVEQFCCSVLPDWLGARKGSIIASPNSTQAPLFSLDSRLPPEDLHLGIDRVQGTNLQMSMFNLGKSANVVTGLATDGFLRGDTTSSRQGVDKAALVNVQVPTATQELARRNIQVSEVRPYDPRNAQANLRAYTNTAEFIPANSSVTLFEREGKVAFYTVNDTLVVDAETERKIAELEKRKAEVVDVADANARLTTLREDRSSIEQGMGALDERIAQLNDNTTRLEATRAQAETQVGTLTRQLAELDATRAETVTSLAALQADVDTIRQSRTEEASQLKEIAAERQAMAEAISSLKDNVAELRKEREALTREVTGDRRVTLVSGVSDDHLERLRKIDVVTVRDLANATPAQLREAGVSATEARTLIRRAGRLLE